MAPNLLSYLKSFAFPGHITVLHMRPSPHAHSDRTACNDADPGPTLRTGVHCRSLASLEAEDESNDEDEGAVCTEDADLFR